MSNSNQAAQIELRDLSIDFPILSDGSRSIQRTVVDSVMGGRIGETDGHRVVQALRNVTLRIKTDERVGLVGPNGAGKTTLLRVLNGTYPPTSGTIRVHGRIGSLLNITLGINPWSTGHENILVRSALMGIPRAEVLKKYDEIVNFTELGDFLDLPVHTYSSGMSLRLAFSIATAYPTDIILMDEWLSAGDKDFNAKADERMKGLTEQTGILVLASHSPDALKNICNRLIWLEHGEVRMDGPIEAVSEAYFGG